MTETQTLLPVKNPTSATVHLGHRSRFFGGHVVTARNGLALALAVVVATTLGCGGKSDKEKFDDRVKETSHNLHCNTDVLITGTMSAGCP